MGTVVPSFFPSSAQLWVKKPPSLYHETKSSPSHTPPRARPNQSIRTFPGIPVPIHVSHVPSPPALSLSLYRRLAARSQTSLHKPPSVLRSFPSFSPLPPSLTTATITTPSPPPIPFQTKTGLRVLPLHIRSAQTPAITPTSLACTPLLLRFVTRKRHSALVHSPRLLRS